jgi:hypothetical protein
MQNITHSLGIIFLFLYVEYYIISAVTNQICRIDPNDGIWGFWHNAPKRGISGFMKVKGGYWQCSLQSRVQAAIYLRHLPADSPGYCRHHPRPSHPGRGNAGSIAQGHGPIAARIGTRKKLLYQSFSSLRVRAVFLLDRFFQSIYKSPLLEIKNR